MKQNKNVIGVVGCARIVQSWSTLIADSIKSVKYYGSDCLAQGVLLLAAKIHGAAVTI
jgi:hypothetical protein